MGTKNTQDSINLKIQLLHILHRTGKVPKTFNLSRPTIYGLLDTWSSVGFVVITKKGRDLSVILTQKGKEFVNSLEKLSSLVCFL